MAIIACGGGMTVSLEGDKEREFYDAQPPGLFLSLLEKSFGVTLNELYGK